MFQKPLVRTDRVAIGRSPFESLRTNGELLDLQRDNSVRGEALEPRTELRHGLEGGASLE